MQSKRKQEAACASKPEATASIEVASLPTERLLSELRTRRAENPQASTPDVAVALSCATELELWDELCERYTSCVLAYSKPGKGRFEGLSNVYWFGTIPEAIGLSRYIQLDLKQRLIDNGLEG